MARVPQQPDRNFPPSESAETENLARLLDQSEIPEIFDDAIRLRFGKMISAAAVKKGKRH